MPTLENIKKTRNAVRHTLQILASSLIVGAEAGTVAELIRYWSEMEQDLSKQIEIIEAETDAK